MISLSRIGVVPVAAMLFAAAARAEDPKLAPGRDPGGAAVAVLADGFDYTRAEVARVLARDGEGEAIAWDAVDGDHRPFAGDGGGTANLLAAVGSGGVRIVAVRVATGDPASLAKGVAFVASTPARVVLVALPDQDRRGLEVMAAAAKRFEAMLFVASLPGPAAHEAATGDAIANLVLLDSKERPYAAAEAVAQALGCERGDLAGPSGSDLERAFLERLSQKPPAACEPKDGAGSN